MISAAGWLRQARHRAKKHNVSSDVTTQDVDAILAEYRGACAYCGSEATGLDNPLPLSDGAPNVPANVLPCCKGCKDLKRNHNMVWMYDEGHMTPSVYVSLVQSMLARRGGESLKPVLRRAAGVVSDD